MTLLLSYDISTFKYGKQMRVGKGKLCCLKQLSSMPEKLESVVRETIGRGEHFHWENTYSRVMWQITASK